MKDYVLRFMSDIRKFELVNFMMTREMVFFEVWLTITFLNMVAGTVVTGLIAASLTAQYWMVKHGKHPFFQKKVVLNLSGRTGTSAFSNVEKNDEHSSDTSESGVRTRSSYSGDE